MPLFQNRREAANELARSLSYLKSEHPIVLGLANAGVPIAETIATHLEAPLDILLIERLSAPSKPDHIVGAVDEHGRISTITGTARWHHVTSHELVEPARDAFRNIQHRRGRFRAILPELEVRDRTVIIVSQGVATGAKMLGAIASVRDRGARKIIAAAPAGATKATWHLNEMADSVVIPHRPSKFVSVADFYSEFSEVTDELVTAIISKWVKSRQPQEGTVRTLVMKLINDAKQALFCDLDLPPGCQRGSGPYPVVIFAHNLEGDGQDPRTQLISRRIAKRGLIGVRADFTGHGRSEGDLSNASEARMLSDLTLIHNSVIPLDEADDGRMGLVGTGSGALLCLELARQVPNIAAIVIRSPLSGGEINVLKDVTTPTLLIHAGLEQSLDDSARGRLPSKHQIVEIPDATALFNDPISLEMMIGASVEWLADHLLGLPSAAAAVAESLGEAQPSTGPS
ncbi:MAG: hypothetical protein JSV91_15260 [Phycisphaerales bacterium]|nr:MAG: hypothetical protein JSV91_15260 [Phycisphaerales bacterium]